MNGLRVGIEPMKTDFKPMLETNPPLCICFNALKVIIALQTHFATIERMHVECLFVAIALLIQRLE